MPKNKKKDSSDDSDSGPDDRNPPSSKKSKQTNNDSDSGSEDRKPSKKSKQTNDSDSGEEDRKPPASKKSKQSKSSSKSNDDEDSWSLGKNKFVKVREFKGKLYVDIREYYDADGELKPGKKGISLTTEQWKLLTGLQDDVNDAVKRKA